MAIIMEALTMVTIIAMITNNHSIDDKDKEKQRIYLFFYVVFSLLVPRDIV